jgi:hypothetical protein
MKGSRESSSPTTSEDKSFQPDFKPPSPLPTLSLPVKRSSLSRSESYSVPNVLEQSHAPSVSQARSFQRVASTPASGTATPGNASSLRAMRPLARRVTSEDREGNQDPRMPVSSRVPAIDERQQEEKENLGGGGRPLSFPLPSDHQDDFPYVAASSTPGPPSLKLQGPTRMVVPTRSRVDAYPASAGRAQTGMQRSQSQTQRGSQRIVAARSTASVSFGRVEAIKLDGEDTDLGTSLCFPFILVLNLILQMKNRRSTTSLLLITLLDRVLLAPLVLDRSVILQTRVRGVQLASAMHSVSLGYNCGISFAKCHHYSQRR